jgi:hypothetical protein
VRFVEHHAAVLAIPAVLPALIVVSLVVILAMRDRRQQRSKPSEENDPE